MNVVLKHLYSNAYLSKSLKTVFQLRDEIYAYLNQVNFTEAYKLLTPIPIYLKQDFQLQLSVLNSKYGEPKH